MAYPVPISCFRPQGTSTEILKAYVHNEPIVVEQAASASTSRLPSALQTKTSPSVSAHKPVTAASTGSSGKQKNEIFVDILERLSVLFGANGQVLHSSIDGCIQMKSYLSGNPELRLALNEDLVIGRNPGDSSPYGAVTLDDCNFHECVKLDDWDTSRQLSLIPPDGEFSCLNYRITGEFRAPFRLFPTVTETDALHLELLLVVRADMPDAHYGGNVSIRIPVPRTASTVSAEIDQHSISSSNSSSSNRDAGKSSASSPAAAIAAAQNQSAEYSAAEKRVIWSIRKFQGGSEQTLRIRVTLAAPCTVTTRKELGPVSMQFEVPMYNVSGVQVRYLKIADGGKSYNPFRWVRYVTQSSSYVARIG